MFRRAILTVIVNFLLLYNPVLSRIVCDSRTGGVINCTKVTSNRSSKFGFIVSLQREIDNTWHPFCGGSIYAPKLILTAAHCVQGITNLRYNDLRIYYGAENLFSDGETTFLDSIIKHPLYDPKVGDDFDIAVLAVSSIIYFSGSYYVDAVHLPRDPTPVNAAVTVSGWGVTVLESWPFYRPFRRPFLLKADLFVIPLGKCKREYENYGRNVTDRMLCATQHGRERDACQGDYGYPLVLKGTKTIVGIVSWGNGCDSRAPGVYTDIYKLRDFIQRVEEFYYVIK